MCIAICKKAGIAIKEDILETCFNANPDGAGFAIEESDGSFLIQKGYFSFKDFMDAFLPHEKKKALIHFRIKTHGQLNEENCHPFQITDDLVFMHNGIISNVDYNKNKSDTMIFNEHYLKPLVDRFGASHLQDPVVKSLIESFIGGSKLAFLVKGMENFLIFNESKGNTSAEGIWFSNFSWQAPKPAYKNNKYDYGSPWDKKEKAPHPALPWKPKEGKSEIPVLSTYKGRDFSFGTLVRVNSDINHVMGTIPKGACGEVHAVYNDYTLDIDFYDSLGSMTDVPTFGLEIIDNWDSWEYYRGDM